ncbi:Conserved hypothetical protein (plasmid) [Sinorhizobium fredii HH103]|nr:Conserved hypothetical protein [Sinorhizobium fredii HH103]
MRRPSRRLRGAVALSARQGSACDYFGVSTLPSNMSLTTDLIADLLSAANEVDKLNPYEVSGLLDRSIDTIRDVREQTGVASSYMQGVVVCLRISSERVGHLSEEDVRRSLVTAAEVLSALVSNRVD